MAKIQLRRSTTEAGWLASVIVLASGEPGVAIDTGEVRVGDGVNVWSALPSPSTVSKLATRKGWARNPDLLIAGTVTRNSDGAATSAPVVWPDGVAGTYTANTLSSTFAGAVDGYSITYGSPVTATYTQPTITRDSNGAASVVPAIIVA